MISDKENERYQCQHCLLDFNSIQLKERHILNYHQNLEILLKANEYSLNYLDCNYWVCTRCDQIYYDFDCFDRCMMGSIANHLGSSSQLKVSVRKKKLL